MAPERRAILILLGLAVAGQGVRYAITRPVVAPGDVRVLPGLPGHSATDHAEAIRTSVRPLAEVERLDADHASAQELARLPRVGLALAKRIVADRDSHGPFASLTGLDRVAGIGPGMLKVLEPHLRFSGQPRSSASPQADRAPGGDVTPGRVNINSANAAELERLPLIGPSRALAIVAWREHHGSFGGEEDLIRVPGVSSRMVQAIRDRITF